MSGVDPVAQKKVEYDTCSNKYGLVTPAPFAYGRESQLDQVLARFFIAQETVSRGEFLRFVEDTEYAYDDASRDLMDLIAPDDECPATPVSWLDAKEYVRWMRKVTRQYYSLPTDKEWEYAARGQFGKPYPWGTISPNRDHATFSTIEMPCYRTGARGKRNAGQSPFGCNDMVGNVWEWTLDSYDDENVVHGLRGGSCMDGADTIRCTSRRYEIDCSVRIPYAGFRMTWLPEDLLGEYQQAIAGASYGERTIVSEPSASLEVKRIRGEPAQKNR